jgi:hypothetical protein
MKISEDFGGFVDILLLCWYFLLFRCCFVGLIWCFVVAGLKEVSGKGKKKKVVPAKENTGEKKKEKKNKKKN